VFEYGTRSLDNNRVEIIVKDKHSSLLEPFVSYAKNEVFEYGTRSLDGTAYFARL
jgi:hypothetical protein